MFDTILKSNFLPLNFVLGLCIDYMAHMARGYMVAEGSNPLEKVRHTLSTVGVAMSNAVVTSILGVAMLSAAGSFANRSFFKSMFVIFVSSYIFGVWLFPAILSLIAPMLTRPNSSLGERTAMTPDRSNVIQHLTAEKSACTTSVATPDIEVPPVHETR